jgi:hypothetical protein
MSLCRVYELFLSFVLFQFSHRKNRPRKENIDENQLRSSQESWNAGDTEIRTARIFKKSKNIFREKRKSQHLPVSSTNFKDAMTAKWQTIKLQSVQNR